MKSQFDANTDSRQDPYFGAAPPLDFETIRKVIENSRNLAAADFNRHLAAVAEAENEDEKGVALHRLNESGYLAHLADDAYRSLVSSEAAFRGAAQNLVHGYMEVSQRQAMTSSDHLAAVSERLNSFGERAPQSKFFASLINAAIKVDQKVGKLESDVNMTVNDFSAGMKAFSKRVSDFGSVVSKFPSKVIEVARSAGVTTASTVASAANKFMTGLGRLFDKVVDKVDDKITEAGYMAQDAVDATKASATGVGRLFDKVDDKITEVGYMAQDAVDATKASAWTILKESTRMVAQIQTQVEKAIDAIADHRAVAAGYGNDVVSLSGGLLSKLGQGATQIGRKAADDYSARLNKVSDERNTPRSSPRP